MLKLLEGKRLGLTERLRCLLGAERYVTDDELPMIVPRPHRIPAVVQRDVDLKHLSQICIWASVVNPTEAGVRPQLLFDPEHVIEHFRVLQVGIAQSPGLVDECVE